MLTVQRQNEWGLICTRDLLGSKGLVGWLNWPNAELSPKTEIPGLTNLTVTTRMTPALGTANGSDESRFNVSLMVRDKVTRQCVHTRSATEWRAI